MAGRALMNASPAIPDLSELRDLIPLAKVRELLPCRKPGARPTLKSLYALRDSGRLPDVAPFKQLALSNFYQGVYTGRIRAVRIGGHYFIPPDELARLADPRTPTGRGRSSRRGPQTLRSHMNTTETKVEASFRFVV